MAEHRRRRERRGAAWAIGLAALAAAPAADAQLLGKPGATTIFGPEGTKILAMPTDAEVMAAVPPGKKAEGSAVIHCQVTAAGGLSACEKTLERGSGLAQALISLAPKYRIQLPQDVPPGEDVAVITATWPAPTTPADWQVEPKPGDFATTYTDAAWHSDRPGFTVMNCLEGKLGTLYQCTVVFQTPPGKGFGAMMLRFAGYLKLKPAQLDGKPVNSGVNVVFHFNAHTPGKAEKNPF
jgi:hypothetical protein